MTFLLAYLYVHHLIFLSMVVHMHNNLMYTFGNWLIERMCVCMCVRYLVLERSLAVWFYSQCVCLSSLRLSVSSCSAPSKDSTNSLLFHRCVFAHVCLTTGTSLHRYVYPQVCLFTGVSLHRCVFAQVSLHRCVYPQVCLSTGVSLHRCVYRRVRTGS